ARAGREIPGARRSRAPGPLLDQLRDRAARTAHHSMKQVRSMKEELGIKKFAAAVVTSYVLLLTSAFPQGTSLGGSTDPYGRPNTLHPFHPEQTMLSDTNADGFAISNLGGLSV